MMTYEEAEQKAAAIPPDPGHIGPGCGRGIVVSVATTFSSKPIVMRCGNTGLYGSPEFCRDCAPRYANRDWRREAEDAGEQWDEEPY